MTRLEKLPNATFGVELEFLGSDDYDNYRDEYYDDDDDEDDYESSRSGEYSEIANRIRKALRRTFPNNTPTVRVFGDSRSGADWVVKDDCSCGVEVTSPALTWEKCPELEVVADVLSQYYEVNNACGLHVHHDISGYTAEEIRRLVLYWAVMESAIFSLVKSNRLENQYCRGFLSGYYGNTVQHLEASLRPVTRTRRYIEQRGRYFALNLTNWWFNGRAEIRMHHGTLEADEIMHWVALTQVLLYAMAQPKRLTEISALNALDAAGKHEHLVGLISAYAPTESLPYLLNGMKKRIKTHYGTSHKKILESVYAEV